MAGKGGKQNKKASKALPQGGMLRIMAKRDGFRRCGRAWSAKPAEVSAEEFTQEELQTLIDEPMLVIESVEPENPGKE